jgi:hypothetical protein
MPLPSVQVGSLLTRLCTQLGFCLPGESVEMLRASPPETIDAFTDAVFVLEGLERPVGGDLRRRVRAIVAEAVRVAEQQAELARHSAELGQARTDDADQ